jgi:nucleotide-binding universal stress UspA family protein
MQTLIAIDNSDASASIVDQIAARAWAKEARFTVLHVTEPSHLWTLATTAEELSRRSEAVVGRAVERLTAAGLAAEGVRREGDPKSAILDCASEIRASRIVLGSRGASGLDRLLLGSVAAGVLRAAPCSVWVIRPGLKGLPKKVLLATDGSECSEQAARSLTVHPLPVSTEVRVMSVVEYYLPPEVTLLQPPGVDPMRVNQIREQAMATAEDAVDGANRILESTYPNRSQAISVLLEKPADLILREAQEWGADWITMGSHGRRGASRFLIGSVSEYVATHAKCSVAIER